MIKALRSLSKWQVLGILFLLLTVSVEASSGTTVHNGLATSGDSSKALFADTIQRFKWVIAFVPIWFAWFFADKMKEYLANKEEQGQYEPKVSKNMKVISAMIAGIIVAYIIIGAMAMVFLDMNFADSWSKIVVEPWKELFGV